MRCSSLCTLQRSRHGRTTFSSRGSRARKVRRQGGRPSAHNRETECVDRQIANRFHLNDRRVVTKRAHHHLAIALKFRMAGDPTGSPSFTKVGQVDPVVVSVMHIWTKDGKSLLVHRDDCIAASCDHFTIGGSDRGIDRKKGGNSFQFSIIYIEGIARHQATNFGFGLKSRNSCLDIHGTLLSCVPTRLITVRASILATPIIFRTIADG